LLRLCRTVPFAPHGSTWPEQKGRTTVLLVDSDLSFAFWIGRALDAAGYNAVPARDLRAATELIQEHRILVDILVIDPGLSNALPFLLLLRQTRPALQAIAALSGETEELGSVTDFDVVNRKPRCYTRDALIEWINLVDATAQRIVRPSDSLLQWP
jgi:hypothetical protein